MRIKPNKIMCAVDFSDFSTGILSYGAFLAKEYGSTLYLCHIIPDSINIAGHIPSSFDCLNFENQLIDSAKNKLSQIAQDLDIKCEIMISSGHPADQIERLAHKHQMDMVIVATHGGSGVKRLLIGSVTDRLVKTLNCPLLVLHGHTPDLAHTLKLNKILVGCDFSEDSKLAFDYALSLAQEFQTQLHLAHVIQPLERFRVPPVPDNPFQGTYSGVWDHLIYPDVKGQSEIKPFTEADLTTEKIKNQLMEMIPEDSQNWCSPVTVVLEGQAYTKLIEYASQENIDMIVLGIRGHTLLEKFLVGSTTDRVIRKTACPVLAVRHIVSHT